MASNLQQPFLSTHLHSIVFASLVNEVGEQRHEANVATDHIKIHLFKRA